MERMKSAVGVALALGIAATIFMKVERFGWARGGVYTQTRHGDATTGVRRVPNLPPGDCGHCHQLHGTAGTASGFALWMENTNQLCYTCHSGESPKETYRGSIIYENSVHESEFLVRWPGPEPPPRTDPASSGICVNCHTPHGWGDDQGLIPSLLFKREEGLCLGCHKPAGSAVKEIETQMQYQFTHQITSRQMAGRHDAGEEMVSANFSGQERHAECVDCHNVHVHTSDLHQQGTNRASGVLLGASFVEAVYGAAPETFPSFQPKDQTFDIQFEYQLCFKCHSYWAYGSFPPLLPGGGGQQTDQSIEFNPNNVSSHNVIQTPNLDLRITAFVNGWSRSSQMYCSDCHGSNRAQDPQGPHGSQLQFLLKAPWNLDTGQRTTDTSDHLCFLCHDFSTYAQPNDNRGTGFSAGNFSRNLHGLHSQEDHPLANRPIACMDCHNKIPHGMNRRAMLVVSTDPARLRGGTVLLLASDIPNWGPTGDWEENDCNVACHD
ncbi:MAG: hypothetical protein Kow0099_19010 [Candidatus Abyssubacteria bacterium]